MQSILRYIHRQRLLLVVLGLMGFAHIGLASGWSPIAQTFSAFILFYLIPGVLLVEWLCGFGKNAPNLWDRLLWAGGAGYTVMTIGMLWISYWPGGVGRAQVVVLFDLLIFVLLAAYWWRSERSASLPAGEARSLPHHPPVWLTVLAVLALLILGLFFRFKNLGYAEFLTDEARVVLRATAVVQGHEDVLFIHRKGPVEILLPAALDAATGYLDETTARLPFAIASLLGLLAVFRLGWQFHSQFVGWIGAFLLLFDGYSIAFARFVQYQSVVLLTSAIAVLIVYRALRATHVEWQPLALAASLVATGLLAHYDGAVVLIPLLFLLSGLRQGRSHYWPTVLRTLWIPTVVAATLLLTFYVPFLGHTHFAATYDYLMGERIAGGAAFPYNNLYDVFRRSAVYNSLYYLIPTLLALVMGMAWVYWRGYGRISGLLLSSLLVMLLAVTVWQTNWLRINGVDWLLFPVALLFVLIWLAPHIRLEERTLWLWFGGPFLLAHFLIAYPGTHVYVFFTPAVLLVGVVIQQQWRHIRVWFGPRVATLSQASLEVVAALLFGVYAYCFFVYNEVEILRVYESNQPAGQWTPFHELDIDRLYGFPLNNGWKAISMLYQQGVLAGDYETNQRSDFIPDWYLPQQHRCASTAQWYFVVDTLEHWALTGDRARDLVRKQGYLLWGEILVNNSPRLQIYQANGKAPAKPHQVRLEEYEAAFNAMPRVTWPVTYPTVEPTIVNPLHINFDNQIWLAGYHIEQPARLNPGDTIRLTLYWRAERPINKLYNPSCYVEIVRIVVQEI